jgi:tetratricopeptide (TPR) repeat protein
MALLQLDVVGELICYAHFSLGTVLNMRSQWHFANNILMEDYRSHSRNVSFPLKNLANLFLKQNKCEEAEPFYQRARSIQEKAPKPSYREIATLLGRLTVLYRKQEKYEKAEPFFTALYTSWNR